MFLGKLNNTGHLGGRRLLFRRKAGNWHLGQAILLGEITKGCMLRNEILAFGIGQPVFELLVKLLQLGNIAIRISLKSSGILRRSSGQSRFNRTDLLDRQGRSQPDMRIESAVVMVMVMIMFCFGVPFFLVIVVMIIRFLSSMFLFLFFGALHNLQP
ncbi:hypothetical protein D3C75_994610 [compost metagenome]